MESLSFCSNAAIHHNHRTPHFLRRLSSFPLRPATATTISAISFSSKPRRLSVKAFSPSSSHKNPSSPLQSIFKPLAVTLAASAALLLASSFHKPSLASTPYPTTSPESDTLPSEDSKAPLTDEDKERILEEYLDLRPDDVRSLRALMELKIKSGKMSEAIAIIDRLLLLQPDDKDLPLLKAHLQAHDGNVEAAKAAFEELIEKDPFLVEAYHGLVMTAATEMEPEQGVKELDSIVKRVEAAMEACKKEKRKEDLRDFKLLIAQVKVTEGKYDEALKVYNELVKEEPRDFRPYLCQGIVYSVLKKKDEAEKQFEKYRRLVPRGHPYAKYFDDNAVAMKVFGQLEENKKERVESKR